MCDFRVFRERSVIDCVHLTAQLQAPTPRYKPIIYKDECTLCYCSDIVSTEQIHNSSYGINICLTCYNGACTKHVHRHYENSKHSIILNHKRYERSQQSIATPISVNDLIQSDHPIEYDTVNTVYCIQCQAELVSDNSEIAVKLQSYIDIIQSTDSANKPDIVSFDDTPQPCAHTINLQQHINHTVTSKQLSQCSQCELKNNLWLCMQCGNLGCGRQQAGTDVSGNGHALQHYNTTHHAVALKLGTIKTADHQQDVTADLFCYECDNTVLDNKLQQHLQTLGIIASEQTITEKTTTELSLQQNLSHNWSLVIDSDGSTSQLLYGTYHTGLQNLGNTCYMASVIQVLFSIPQFQHEFYINGQHHINTCTHMYPSQCYMCQLCKLGIALLNGEYSAPPTQQQLHDNQQQYINEQNKKQKLLSAVNAAEPTDTTTTSQSANHDRHIELQPGIKPTMFKKLIAGQHLEFSTNKQQDALEYLHYMIDVLKRQHSMSSSDTAPLDVFNFKLEDRLQCQSCHRVRYKSIAASEIQLPIVHHSSTESNICTWSDCIHQWLQPTEVEYNCPHCQSKTTAHTTQRYITYPTIALVQMRRFVFDNWVPSKDDTAVQLDGDTVIDFSIMKGSGKQSDEIDLPVDTSASSTSIQADTGICEQLQSMGFGVMHCQRACIAVNNSSVDDAMNWLLQHMDDPDINQPITNNHTNHSHNVSADAVAQLESMGFDSERCRYALTQTDNNIERACDWLFSHMDTPLPSTTTSSIDQLDSTSYSTESGKYELLAYITHLGKSIHSGHYVAHVKRDNEWILFNDNKVSVVTKPAQQYAYLLFFRKLTD